MEVEDHRAPTHISTSGAMRSIGVLMEIPALADALNRASGRFEIGRLQELRASLRSLSRAASRTIFDRRTTHSTYAFHLGGRKELQFNIGAEDRNGRRVIRHGVAFSLELSQSLPSIEPLLPKIARFNDYVRSHPEDFPGFRMWHHDQLGCHAEHGVASIDGNVARAGTFIMLGRWVLDADVSVDEILLDFDRLLPLFAYVESDGARMLAGTTKPFRAGCPEFVSATKAFSTEKIVDIALRHKWLQGALYTCLSAEAGSSNVAIEHPLELGVRVDAAVRIGKTFAFYELKVAPSVQACVRPAIGQLLEYAHWPDAARAEELIIVGECVPDDSARVYLQSLRRRFSLPVWYRQLSSCPAMLGPKI